MQFFKCRVISDKSFLESDLAVECGSSKHMLWMLTLAIPSLLVYVLAFPITILFVLLSLRELDKSDVERRAWSFLFDGYREEIFFW